MRKLAKKLARGKVHLPMKKAIRKLVVRRETIRVLDDRHLSRAVGGGDLLAASGGTCPTPLAESGNVYCPAPAIAAISACS